MNWFLLLLILKLLNVNWAAPIDLLEAKDDLQQDKEILDNLINKGFSVADAAQNLFNTTADVINSTESVYNFTTFSASLNENAQKISEDLQNFTLGVEKEVEENYEKPTTKQTVETTTTNQESIEQVSAIINSNVPVTEKEIKQKEISMITQNPTENVDKILQNFNNDNIFSVNETGEQSVVTENISNDFKSSTESYTFTDNIITPAYEESFRNIVKISENQTVKESENKPAQNIDFTTGTSASSTEQVSQYSENISEQTIPNSNTQSIVENVYGNIENLYNQSLQLINNVINKATEQSSNEELANTASNQDSTTVNTLKDSLASVTLENKVKEISLIPIENATEQSLRIADLVLVSNSSHNDKQLAMKDTTEFRPEEISSETPALKQAVDEFINQVSDIGSSIKKAAEELRIDALMMPASAESFSSPQVPNIIQESINETEMPADAENSKPVPSFKEAVDSFIEDVVEIGSKLGLIPEEKPNDQLTTTTKSLSESVNTETTFAAGEKEHLKPQEVESSTTNSNSEQTLDSPVVKPDEIVNNLDTNKTDLPTTQAADKVNEMVTTTRISTNNLNKTPENNIEIVENAESSNLGRSVDTLIGAASEIGSKFGKAVSDLFPVSENKPESVTESLNDGLQEKTNEQLTTTTDSLSDSMSTETTFAASENEHLQPQEIESSTLNSNLQQSLDSYVVKLNDIASNTEVPIIIQESINETEVPAVADNFQQAPSFKHAEDYFIGDVVEIGSELGLILEENPNGQLATTTESLRESVSTETTFAAGEKEHLKPQEVESSTSNSNLQQSLDSFVVKLDEIASNTEVPIIIQESMNETEVPPVADNFQQAPSFKHAVDYFVEDVVEIGSKVGLILEEKSNRQSTTTSESLSESVSTETTFVAGEKEHLKPQEIESSTSNSNLQQSLDYLVVNPAEIDNNLDTTKTDLPTTQAADKVNEMVTTTPNSTDDLNKNPEHNKERVENAESSNLGRSVETLIGAASEIGSNFGKAVSDLFTVSENKPVSVTKILNEGLKETTTPDVLNNLKNSEMPSIHNSMEISERDSTNTWLVDHENISVSSTTPTANESFQYSTEEIVKPMEENHEEKPYSTQEGENLTRQVSQENLPKEEYAEYIPVAVISIPETAIPTQQSEIPLQLETVSLNSETKQVVQAAQGEEKIIEHEQPETTEATHKEENDTTNSVNESEMTSTTNESLNDNLTSTTALPAIEETTHALTKFENTLKTLIEQEKLKHVDKHANSLETSQQEATTWSPNTSTTLKDIVTTTKPLEDTTILPKKFEEELQMAVKALEETTHHHFEEFQNNLKEAFKKFTVWGAENERPQETTSIFKNSLNEAETTQQPLNEQSTTRMIMEETSQDSGNVMLEDSFKSRESTAETRQDSSNVMLEDSFKTEQPHRSGVINQQFVDKFADNYQETETAEVTTTEMQTDKHKSSQLTGLLQSLAKSEEVTETPIVTTTMLPAAKEEQFELKQNDNFVAATTMQNVAKEDLVSTGKSYVREITGAFEETTTEYITESPIIPLLVGVPLEKDINSISLTLDNETNTEAATPESTTQQLKSEQVKESHSKSSQTIQTNESVEEIITLPTTESNLQEMVTFIEHSDSTTVAKQQKPEPRENEESSATSQTQEPLTQASFMEEQQQQIESTSEHDAQTQTTDTSGQTATTTTADDDTLEQQTTEKEIHSTTVVEEDVMTMTTTIEPPTTTITAVAPVEPEARSLSLPPPKLEYLQNEDGVEVFYGYSIVKHN